MTRKEYFAALAATPREWRLTKLGAIRFGAGNICPCRKVGIAWTERSWRAWMADVARADDSPSGTKARRDTLRATGLASLTPTRRTP